MALHGQAREEQRSRDYQRTELMSIGERLREAEAALNSVNRRLEQFERMLTVQYGTVQSEASDLPGR